MQKRYFYSTLIVLMAILGFNKSEAQITKNFGATQSPQTFTVPAGVSTIHVDAYGAWGGNGSNGGVGGYAGEVTADLAVTSGQVLTIYVGTQGFPSEGGYNGGGMAVGIGASYGGSGGGASDIRIGGTGLANRVLVAGGGGGASSAAKGGAGGGLIGGSGIGLPSASGGSQVAGGIGYAGNNGDLGIGGDAASGGVEGAGGGGYYGGGANGLGIGGGGGGGSSYTSPTLCTNVIHTQGTAANGADGNVALTYAAPPPTILQFSPTVATTGNVLTIKGSGFTGATAVSIGGADASSFTVVSDTVITAIVSMGITDQVAVTTPGGVSSVGGYTYSNSLVFIPPSITSFTPTSTCPGKVATIFISGNGFTGATAVTIGGVSATSFTVNSNNNITAIVPASTVGIIKVTTPTTSINSTTSFTNATGYTSYAYITNQNTHTVTVVNTATNTILNTITVGYNPVGTCVSPDGNTVYIANRASNTVSFINTATNTVSATVVVGDSPWGVAVSPDGTTLYVANSRGTTISVINTATQTITATVKMPQNIGGLKCSPDGSKLYIVNNGSNSISVLNTATNTLTKTIVTGNNPQDVCVSADGSRVYVTNNGPSTVTVIDGNADTAITNVQVGAWPIGLSLSLDGTYLYTANQGGGNVSVLNTATNIVSKTITVGSYPYGVAVSPDGTKVYVENSRDNTISIINPVTNTVTSTVSIGNGPGSIGNFMANVPTACCKPTTATITQSACGSYLWHGTTYTTSGVYTFDSLNKGGCDSLTTLNLTLNQPSFTSTNTIKNGVVSTFNYTGSAQTFKVPAGVTSLHVVANGAQGGRGWMNVMGMYLAYQSGGNGGKVEGDLAVTAGQQLIINVGGAGDIALAGWNGGGTALQSGNDGSGGGGGATDIRIGDTALINRVLVAGAGGGAGNQNVGGVGGGLVGGNTGFTTGGTQTTGGTNYNGVVVGSLGVGADGGEMYGGGGAGYYGGGSTTSNVYQDAGSGGSSYTSPTLCTNVVLTQGANAGNGSITLTYNALAIVPDTTQITICNSQLPYSWNGITANAAGIYTSHLTNSVGCDSTAPMKLMVITSIPASISISSHGNDAVCGGTSVTYYATPGFGGGSPSYQWKVNGVNAGSNSDTYAYTPSNNDVISCVITASDAGICYVGTATSNSITESVTPVHAVSVSVSSGGMNSVCAGTNVNFTATQSFMGGSPVYQWKVNGVNVGANYYTYAYTPSNSDVISCVITASQTNYCYVGIATSNSITESVTPVHAVSVSVSSGGMNSVCAGTNVNFTATQGFMGGSPVYQWKVNGANVGTNNYTYAYTPANNDVISCVITASQINYCYTGTATSNSITETVNTSVTPSVSIAANPLGSIVSGTSVTYTATPINAGSNPTYQWKKNGSNIGTNGATYTDGGLVNNDAITCILTANNSCQTAATANSNSITETVTPSILNYTWTGVTSTDWNVATNWSNNVLPTSGVTVTIPSAPTNQPVLSTDFSVGGIVLNGSIAINGHSLTITGAVSGTGKLKGSATSSLTVNSSSNSTINFGTTVTDSMLANLTVSGSGTFTLGSGLGITTLLTVSSGSLNTGNHLTLKSTSIANTAVVGPVGGTVTGNVTVERFIPQGIKAYQSLITGGVYNTGSIFKNWQESGINNNGYGIFITGKKGTVAGVDATTGLDVSLAGNISMYNYTNYLTYTPVTNTKTTSLDPYTGYLTVVYGNRVLPLIPGAVFDASPNMNASATIRTTGSLVTGTVTYSNTGVSNSNFSSAVTKILPSHDTGSFIANPYACAIDWNLSLIHI